jgi:hypothetical protein
VVNAIGDTGQRNIMMNLAPQATAAAVGAGQFGSKRGAEVLGQTMSNAQRDILNQQYQALNTGYNDALKTALGQKQLEGQLASTAGQLESSGQQNLTAAGSRLGELASTNQNLSLADINALATLGGQQQTIAQNEELFPLTNISTLAGMLRGYNIPTSTQKTATGSPLSALAGVASLGNAVTGGALGTMVGKGLTDWWNSTSASTPAGTYVAGGGGTPNTYIPNIDPNLDNRDVGNPADMNNVDYGQYF